MPIMVTTTLSAPKIAAVPDYICASAAPCCQLPLRNPVSSEITEQQFTFSKLR